jgi:hypothetical protein
LIFDGGAVEASLAYHHDVALPRGAARPRPVEARAEPRADALHRKA